MCVQVTSKRVANAKSDKYHGNILKRGKVELQKVRPNASKRSLMSPSPLFCQIRMRLLVGLRSPLIGAEEQGARRRPDHARLLPLRSGRLRYGQS